MIWKKTLLVCIPRQHKGTDIFWDILRQIILNILFSPGLAFSLVCETWSYLLLQISHEISTTYLKLFTKQLTKQTVLFLGPYPTKVWVLGQTLSTIVQHLFPFLLLLISTGQIHWQNTFINTNINAFNTLLWSSSVWTSWRHCKMSVRWDGQEWALMEKHWPKRNKKLACAFA